MNSVKRVFAAGLVLSLVLVVGSVPTSAFGTDAFAANEPTLEADASSGTRAMFRLYNPNSGEHFYTSNSAERTMLEDIGWCYEGVGWIAPATSSTPVYRLYNPNAGDHHYTLNAAERDMLVRVGWRYEGIGWYSDDARRVPLWRQYNPNARTGTHNYTTSKAENDQLIRLGWRGEDIGWHAIATGSSGGIFKELKINTGYSDIDLTGDDKPDAVNVNVDTFYTSSRPTIQVNQTTYSIARRADFARLFYWKYDTQNEFLIFLWSWPDGGRAFEVLRLEDGAFSSKLTVGDGDADEFGFIRISGTTSTNGFPASIAVQGKRLLTDITWFHQDYQWREGVSFGIATYTYTLNPATHSFTNTGKDPVSLIPAREWINRYSRYSG